jgi:nucleoid-associated protein YgaU
VASLLYNSGNVERVRSVEDTPTGTIAKLLLLLVMVLLVVGILIWDKLTAGEKGAGPKAAGPGIVAQLEQKAGEAVGALGGRAGLEAARERLGDAAAVVRDEARALTEKAREAARPWLDRPAPPSAPAREAPAAPALTPAAKDRGPGTHTVRPRETLSSIARDRLGHERHWGLLAKANDDQLHGEPDRLKTGMVIRIPAIGRGDRPDPGAVAAASAPRPSAGSRAYRVQPGDTLWRIADRELGDGAQWERIYRANRDRLSSPNDLRVGQVIRLDTP